MDVVNDYKSKVLPRLLEGYEPRNVFNADETGLFWRATPTTTLELKGKKCYGGKLSKERITVLVAANADGTEKLPLFSIGKFKTPRCFKNIKQASRMRTQRQGMDDRGPLFIMGEEI